MNKSSKLEDDEVVQDTDDHAMRVENNPSINENTSIPLVELVQLGMDFDHS